MTHKIIATAVITASIALSTYATELTTSNEKCTYIWKNNLEAKLQCAAQATCPNQGGSYATSKQSQYTLSIQSDKCHVTTFCNYGYDNGLKQGCRSTTITYPYSQKAIDQASMQYGWGNVPDVTMTPN